MMADAEPRESSEDARPMRREDEAGHAVHGARNANGQRRHGVVFVHGIGTQKQSDTILDFGAPLLQWLERWHAARGEKPPRVRSVELSFQPVDEGDANRLPWAAIDFPNGDRWVGAEAWWAASSRHPDFGTALVWSLRYLWAILKHLLRTTWWRLQRLGRADPQPNATTPAWGWRFVDFANTLGLLLLYSLGALLGLVVLLPIILAAQIPIPQLQDFFAVHLLRLFIVMNAGEFRTFLDDELQAANMSRRVAKAVDWLVDPARGDDQCLDVTIVAHSGGCPVTFAMLADQGQWATWQHVTKFVSLGNGMNKAWDIKPDLARLHGPIPSHIHWVDLWASYDPVPAGWMTPPRLGGQWAPIFQPDRQVIATQGLQPRADPNPDQRTQRPKPGISDVYWPVSEQITNYMDVLTDHGGYWANDEQFQVRLAAEIDEELYRHSPYWRGKATLAQDQERTAAVQQAVKARRERVSALALVRDLAILAVLLGILAFLLALVYDGGWGALLHPYADFAGRQGPAYWLVPVFAWLHTHGAFVPLIGGVLDAVVGGPYALVVAALIGGLALMLFLGIPAALWDRWDQAAREAAIVSMANARK